jgi:hypothetical protein
MRIRHYGILSNRHRHETVALCRRLLEVDSATQPESHENVRLADPAVVTPTRVCPICGAGRMIAIEEFAPLPIEVEVPREACVIFNSS